MRQRRGVRLALCILLVAVAGAVAWQVLRVREPVYRGRPISFWIKRWGDVYAPWDPQYPDFDRGGLWWLPGAGPKAVPFLIKALNRRDGLWGKHYEKLWLQSPPWLRARLPRPILAVLIRVNAASALGAMGAAAKPAVPALLAMMRKSQLSPERTSACSALGQLAKQDHTVRAALIKCLSDTQPGVRSGAAFALAVAGPPAREAVPALLRCLQDPDVNTRSTATNALAEIQGE